MNVFVPIYNEIESRRVIENNIRRSIKIFKNVCYYFYDNCSDDGTYEYLKKLEIEYSGHVVVSRNSYNIGFQKNLAKIIELPDDDMIMIIGANDMLRTPGLRNLCRLVESAEYDLIVCNTNYVTGQTNLGVPRISSFDKNSKRIKQKYKPYDKRFLSFEAMSLDEFLLTQRCIPNGIMQYVLHPRHKWLFMKHVHLMSPQVGAFLDFFPGRVYVMNKPALALVNRVEVSGWRSTAEGIIETHIRLAEDIFNLTLNAYSNKKINILSLLYLRFWYTHSVMQLVYKGVIDNDHWGRWTSHGRNRMVYLLNTSFKIVLMSPIILINVPMMILIIVHFIIYMNIKLIDAITSKSVLYIKSVK